MQELLRAGLVDELRVDVMPELLGSGLRLFENLGPDPPGLEKIGVLEVGARTSVRFRVVNAEMVTPRRDVERSSTQVLAR